MLERLADLIRPLLTWRLRSRQSERCRRRGATGDGGFRATPDMMSILGCSADELGHVLKALGFWAERRLRRARGERGSRRRSLVAASAPSNGADAAAAEDAPSGDRRAAGG